MLAIAAAATVLTPSVATQTAADAASSNHVRPAYANCEWQWDTLGYIDINGAWYTQFKGETVYGASLGWVYTYRFG